MAKTSLTLVNSRQLYEQLRPVAPHLYETRTTTLMQTDFFMRQGTCISPPYHLLYAGRITPEKGLFDLVEALSLLVAAGEDVILDLVGWAEEKHGTLEKLEKMVQEKKLSQRLVYHGYKAVGPELFAYFKKADIFVIASQSSEGFPRSILEAMAHSLPVVATKVGSIPLFLDDHKNALLVSPNDPQQLSKAIRLIIKDKNLRQMIIKNALPLAQENTLDVRTKELFSLISNWLVTLRA
jgi:glycosyltransferase involved in cell wall biosynthesis